MFPGAALTLSFGFNDQGTVVGVCYGTFPGGLETGFIATPEVPEPATTASLAAALALLFGWLPRGRGAHSAKTLTDQRDEPSREREYFRAAAGLRPGALCA